MVQFQINLMHVIYNKHAHPSSERLTNEFYNDHTMTMIGIQTSKECSAIKFKEKNPKQTNKKTQASTSKPLNLAHRQHIKGQSAALHHSDPNVLSVLSSFSHPHK